MKDILLNNTCNTIAKKNQKKLKNCKKPTKNSENSIKNNKLDKHFRLVVYIKTLLSIYKNLPNIIKILDRIIERRASSIIPTSSIYNGTYTETYNQINRVINLTERKDKLLNLYIIIEKILEKLNNDDRKLIVLKFIQKNPTHEIAKEMDLTERTIYRRINSVLDKIAEFMIQENWGLDFIINQVGDESWIEETYKKKLVDELMLKNKHYNKSSSSKSS